MKHLFLLSLLIAASGCARKPELVWKITEGLEAPESAYVELRSGLIYVSNVSGSPMEKDGKGFISRVTPEGRMMDLQWIKGLNAPKGMNGWHDELYVADIDRVVIISVSQGSVIDTVPIKGAKFLNDVAVDELGNVYVSDMLANKIYRITTARKPEAFLDGIFLEMPNGLYIGGDKLYVASWGHEMDPKTFQTKTPGRILEFDLKTKNQVIRTPMPFGNLDGLAPDGKGGWFVSDWIAGKIYRVGERGQVMPVFEGFKGPADIGRAGQLLIIPEMMADTLSAYRMP